MKDAAARPGHVQTLAAMHRVVQALQRGVERGVVLGEAEPHHRCHDILLIERRDRNRRDLVVVHDALAERLVGLVEPKRRKIDGQEVGPLGLQNGKSDALKTLRETIAAPRQKLIKERATVVATTTRGATDGLLPSCADML